MKVVNSDKNKKKICMSTVILGLSGGCNLNQGKTLGDCPWDVHCVHTIPDGYQIHIRELSGPRPLRRGVDTAKLGYWQLKELIIARFWQNDPPETSPVLG